jgi:hypothetical protein
VANYATAQMRYRSGPATGKGDVVAKANETFRRIPLGNAFRSRSRSRCRYRSAAFSCSGPASAPEASATTSSYPRLL